MSRFYGALEGGRGSASGHLHADVGLRATCSGGDIGVVCNASARDVEGTKADVIVVYVTGGSSGALGAGGATLGYAKRVDGEVHFQLDGLGCLHLLKPTPENLETLRANKPLMDALFAHLWIRGDLPRGTEDHETA
jgi:hypothetical protein